MTGPTEGKLKGMEMEHEFLLVKFRERLPFQTFRCSRKCAAGTTQIVSVSFISQVFRERFATGLQPELNE